MLYVTCSCTTFITLVLARSLRRLRAIPFEKIVISICGIMSEAYSCATDMIIRRLNFCLLLWLAECQTAIWKQEKQHNRTINPVIKYSDMLNLSASGRLFTRTIKHKRIKRYMYLSYYINKCSTMLNAFLTGNLFARQHKFTEWQMNNPNWILIHISLTVTIIEM